MLPKVAQFVATAVLHKVIIYKITTFWATFLSKFGDKMAQSGHSAFVQHLRQGRSFNSGFGLQIQVWQVAIPGR